MAGKISFQTMTIDDKVRAKRGRKPNVDPELVEALQSLTDGGLLVFDHYGHVHDPEKRSAIQQQLRSAAKVALPDKLVSIEWTPAEAKRGGKDISGWPQVSLRKAKATV